MASDDALEIAPLPRAFYDRPTLEVARDLIGKTLLRRTAEGVAGGMVVETEAYVSAIDPSAHGFRGQTPRNRSMFGGPGRAYVYRSYGIHYCLNVVTESAGVAAAVLIRAIRPLVGVELMRLRRGEHTRERDLARGPGRLCQALALTIADDGADLLGPELWIGETPGLEGALPVAATSRIGITQAADWPWRFVVVGDPYVSARGVRATDAEVE
ncbi:MAG TPA: DNA-3-methyladenine glycosylase [Ktedonobacterales bacterium]|nr:DNA-3-methyladenine glycosylase [Ktedonobacterales bacterium]